MRAQPSLLASMALLALACGARSGESGRTPRPATIDAANAFEVNLPGFGGQLANGVTWVVLPDPTVGSVQVDVRVMVGSADDPDGQRGLAHLVEHLLFLVRPDGAESPRVSTMLEGAAIYTNAFTDYDTTHYTSVGAPAAAATLIETWARAFTTGCRGLVDEDVERERQVVLNELRQRGMGNPLSAHALTLREVYPKGHPYALSIGGTEAGVGALRRVDVCRFIGEQYAPSRLVVVVAGAVDADEVGRIIQKSFGAIAARDPAPRREIPVAEPRGGTRKLLAAVDHAELRVTWPLVPRSAPEALAAALLLEVISEEVASDLAVDGRVISVASGVIGGIHAPVAVLQVVVRDPAHLGKVGSRVRTTLEKVERRLSTGSHWFVQIPLRQQMVFGLAFSLEGLAARTAFAADYVQLAPPGGLREHLAMIAPERSLPAYLFGADRARYLALVPDQDAGAPPPVSGFGGRVEEDHGADDLEPESARQPAALGAAPPPLPPARRFTLDNGLRVVLQPSKSLMPLVTVRLLVDAGTVDDPPDRAGLAELAGRIFLMLPTYGGNRFVPAALRLEQPMALEAVAVDKDVDVLADVTLVKMRTVSSALPSVIEDLGGRGRFRRAPGPIEVLLDFADESVAQEPLGAASPLVFAVTKVLFGAQHPYAHPGSYTQRSLLRISATDLVDFIDDHYSAANVTLIVAGDFDVDAIEKQVRNACGGWRPGARGKPPAKPGRADRDAVTTLALDESEEEDAQLGLLVAWATDGGLDEGGHAARLVLARMLELRLAAVREQLGASYGLSASFEARRLAGAYVARGRIDAGRAGEALALVVAEIGRLRGGGDGLEAAFVRARREVLAEWSMEERTSTSIAAELLFEARFGLAPGASRRIAEAVAALTIDDVVALAAKELAPGRQVIAMVGPRKLVEATFAAAGLPAPKFLKPWPTAAK